LIENQGRMEVIASPRLTPEDVEAINDGLARKEDVVRDSLLRELSKPKGRFEEVRLNLLSNLIASGVLSIKIAVMESESKTGMFHEKLGLLLDSEGNAVAFTGSMNETANAFYQNYESIDVYTSWSADADRVQDKQSAFNAMWGDYEPNLKVVEFPEVTDAILSKYRVTEDVRLEDLDIPEDGSGARSEESVEASNIPAIPGYVKMRKYQEDAIDAWKKSGFRGIFDMATGTGKTFTALAAVSSLSAELNHNLAVVIVCPYQHLVEQWKEDIVAFGMRPIVCYSSSSQKNWRNRVKNSVSGFRIGAIDRFCIVTTNATFSTPFMREQIAKLKGNCLIVADEAHNFGAEKLNSALPKGFKYRLALSATIERHGDERGTQSIFEYFGEKCIEYSLEDAIINDMLTPYYYHPIVVSLDCEELDEYVVLSKKIGQLVASLGAKKGSDLPDSLKMLLIKRARIVAGARSKIPALRETIDPFKEERHLLVYCGATTVKDVDYVEGEPTEDEVKQIDLVTGMLGQDLGMKVSRFTSEENAERREILKKEFSDGRQMQALVAIRCLDEGVNIPNIEKAFILASSTNPKEYVQRRGRVLRKAPGKKHASIYDFITLPVLPQDAGSLPDDVLLAPKSLVAREIARMKDFATISENPVETISLVQELVEVFGVRPDEEEGELYA